VNRGRKGERERERIEEGRERERESEGEIVTVRAEQMNERD
jgi:hypothetical protein